MKTLHCLILLLGMPVLAAGLCAKDFEGMIRLKMTPQDKSAKSSNGNPTVFMNYYVKGGLMRVDMELGNGKTGASIIDPVKHEMTMLMPEQKMYMVMKCRKRRKPTRWQRPRTMWSLFAQEKPTPFSVTNARRSSSKARMAKRRSGGPKALACSRAWAVTARWGGPLRKALGRLRWPSMDSFRLRMVSHDKSGKEQMRMEAVAIDPQSPDNSLFVPPADYQKLEMPSFGGMNPFGK